eukprot:10627858-Alexandrium_andersonii.AAC.1
MQPCGLREDLLEDAPMPLGASVLPRCSDVGNVEQDRVAVAQLGERRPDELTTLVCDQDEGRAEVANPGLTECPGHRRRSL